MAAEREEVSVRGDVGPVEDSREDLADDLLVGGDRVPSGRAVPCCGRGVGEGFAVDLAVGGQRELVHHHERRRHHVGGQGLSECGPQLPGGDQAFGYHITDEPLVVSAVVTGHHHCLGDPVDTGERGFDLPEFDAKTADLDLKVGTTQEIQPPIRSPPHHIPRAIHARPGRTIRISNKPLRSQIEPAVVAPRHPLTSDIQLPRHTWRHQTQPRIQHIHPRIRHRHANGDGGAAAYPVGGRPDRRLRRPIHVGDLHRPFRQGLGEGGGERFPTDEDTQPVQRVGCGVGEHLPQRGGGLHDGGTLGRDEVG